MRSAIVLLGAMALVVTLPHAAQAAHLKASAAKEHAARALNPSYQMAELGGSCGIIPSGQNYVYLTYVCRPSFHTTTPVSCVIFIDELVACNRVWAWVGARRLCRVHCDGSAESASSYPRPCVEPVAPCSLTSLAHTCSMHPLPCQSLLCRCQNPQCCSSAGYCGVGDAWCGKGCQPRKSDNNCEKEGRERSPHKCTFIRPTDLATHMSDERPDPQPHPTPDIPPSHAVLGRCGGTVDPTPSPSSSPDPVTNGKLCGPMYGNAK